MSHNESTVYHEDDADLSALEDRVIAVIGYGNQGRAQARNLADSGVEDIIVGNRKDSSWDQAQEDGFEVYTMDEAATRADVIFFLIPDEVQPEVYETQIEPNLDSGDVINFASGYNISYDFIQPASTVDVVMIAPRMIGTLVRELFEEGRGAPAFMAVEQDASGQARDIALAIAHGIGATRSGVIEGDFEMETITDLMTEQALFPIFVHALMAKYEVERNAGIPPEAIIMEQYLSREMAYIFERAATEGLIEQLSLHSQTSQYGQLTGIEAFDGSPIKEYMEETLRQIQTGEFATEWTLEQQAGYPTMRKLREKYSDTEMIETEQATLDKFGLRES